MLLAGDIVKGSYGRLNEFKLGRDRGAELDVVFSSLMYFLSVDRGIAARVLNVLGYLEVVVLLRTLVEGLDATVGPRNHVSNNQFPTIIIAAQKPEPNNINIKQPLTPSGCPSSSRCLGFLFILSVS